LVVYNAYAQAGTDTVKVAVRIKYAGSRRVVETCPLVPVEKKYVNIIAVSRSSRVEINPGKPLLGKKYIRLPVSTDTYE
jgi:uncharacterized protein with ACT and thioredoxin-like domain